MKKQIIYSLITGFVAMAAVGCGDWTDTKALNFDPNYTQSNHGEAYYANLRDYKTRRDHSVAFGWFSEWTGVGTKMTSQLMGMPDSMDFVSMWGNVFNLNDAKKKDLHKVQQIKGTRVLMCFIVDNIGAQSTPLDVTTPQVVKDSSGNDIEVYVVNGKQYATVEEAKGAFWGWYDSYGPDGLIPQGEREAAMTKAIQKYATSIIDSIKKYNFDGFDMDIEPNYGAPGNLSEYPDRLSILLNTLAAEFGPKSGTDKMLVVDGEPYVLKAGDGSLLNYFIIQAYDDTGVSTIDTRLEMLFEAFDKKLTREQIVEMTILTSNFESYGSTGGPAYVTRDFQEVNQLKGYAMYSYPNINAKIGGIGAFRIGFDTNYRYLRNAIGVLNPVIKQ